MPALDRRLSLDFNKWNSPKRRVLDILVIIVLGILLYAGLKPFHAPANGVHWLQNSSGIYLSGSGTIISSKMFLPSAHGRTLEIWIEPRRIDDQGTIVALYNPAAQRFFALSQEESDLEMHTQSTNPWHKTTVSRLHLPDVFVRNKSSLWTVAVNPSGITVYRDATLTRKSAGFRISAEEFSGRLTIGTLPIFDNDWYGAIRGLAIFDRALSAERIAQHYDAWSSLKEPKTDVADNCIALYIFDEHSGNIAHNRCDSDVKLYLPPKYVVLYPTALDPIWRAFEWKSWFWTDAAISFTGFIPFGFLLCACFSAHGLRRAALIAAIAGGIVSLLIEVVQTRLPTRDSSMSDLIMNFAGSATGAALARPNIMRLIGSQGVTTQNPEMRQP